MVPESAFVAGQFVSVLNRHSSEVRPAADGVLGDLALTAWAHEVAHDDSSGAVAAACRTPLCDVADVTWRQNLFRVFEINTVRTAVARFREGMRASARASKVSANSRYPHQPQLWHLNAVLAYLDAVEAFDEELQNQPQSTRRLSDGWRGLSDYVTAYRRSPGFERLGAEARSLDEQIQGVHFMLLVRGGQVVVAPFDDEPDLGALVGETFHRFRQGDVRDYRTGSGLPDDIDHVQAWILESVARLWPGHFEQLGEWTIRTRDFRDPVLTRFVDEVTFYLNHLTQLDPMASTGMPVSYPELSSTDRTVDVKDGWDLQLGRQAAADGNGVVTNDIALRGQERVLVVSGPNQGGKTTTARMFGQLHLLAAIGCPVPAAAARLPLCDQVLTAFERQESLDSLEGRLGAEIDRLHALLDAATPRSVVVLNELFSSTALTDAKTLTREVLRRLRDTGCAVLCVTFIEELSRLDETTVSLVSQVDPHDPARRTYRVERQFADGRAYVTALARKHGLTPAQITRRMQTTLKEDPA